MKRVFDPGLAPRRWGSASPVPALLLSPSGARSTGSLPLLPVSHRAQKPVKWYAERSALAARAFLLALEKAVDSVVEAPQRYPKEQSGCRRYVLPNQYSLSLVYRLVPDKLVAIVAVAGQWKRPLYWQNR